MLHCSSYTWRPLHCSSILYVFPLSLCTDLLIQWHFIGHLQSKKCNSLCSVKNLFAVHSVDSIKIAMLLDRAWVSQNRKNKLTVYVQVNTSKEPTKSGVTPEDCCKVVDFILHSCEGE